MRSRIVEIEEEKCPKEIFLKRITKLREKLKPFEIIEMDRKLDRKEERKREKLAKLLTLNEQLLKGLGFDYTMQ